MNEERDFEKRVLVIPNSLEQYENAIKKFKEEKPIYEGEFGFQYLAVFVKEKDKIIYKTVYLMPNLHLKMYNNGYDGRPGIASSVQMELNNEKDLEKILKEML